jgi:hypothetical protein
LGGGGTTSKSERWGALKDIAVAACHAGKSDTDQNKDSDNGQNNK